MEIKNLLIRNKLRNKKQSKSGFQRVQIKHTGMSIITNILINRSIGKLRGSPSEQKSQKTFKDLP